MTGESVPHQHRSDGLTFPQNGGLNPGGGCGLITLGHMHITKYAHARHGQFSKLCSRFSKGIRFFHSGFVWSRANNNPYSTTRVR